MENQDTRFCLDIESGSIVEETKVAEAEMGKRFHPLPEWRSLEGFQLMERFVASVRNPIFRHELRNSIATGKGVFRNFKNVLKKRTELEKLWFSFKEREMRSVVFEWMNRIRESRGIEALSPPPEDTEELVYSDFNITPRIEGHEEKILELDRQVFLANYPGSEKSKVLEYYRSLREGLPALGDETTLILVAETPAGDFVGFAWAVERNDPPKSHTVIDLVQLAVISEYQGLGLGQALLLKLIEEAGKSSANGMRIRLEGRFLKLARLFELRGFEVSSQTMDLDLSRWEAEQG
jgi:predicted N-acetyltransferase YhbS